MVGIGFPVSKSKKAKTFLSLIVYILTGILVTILLNLRLLLNNLESILMVNNYNLVGTILFWPLQVLSLFGLIFD
jgi:hypothetical protein